MFRARVAAQGFTVIAMVAGSMYYSKDREKSKELRKLREEKDAEEKRQKWIRELEMRDEEEKAMRGRLQDRIQQKRQLQEDGAERSSEVDTKQDGALLSSMGLWAKGEAAAEQAASKTKEVASEAHEAVQGKSRRVNPKSSLKDVGEALNMQKKEKRETTSQPNSANSADQDEPKR